MWIKILPMRAGGKICENFLLEYSSLITNSVPGLYTEPIQMVVLQARNESRGLVRTNVNLHKIHTLVQCDKGDMDTSYWGSSIITKRPLQSN